MRQMFFAFCDMDLAALHLLVKRHTSVLWKDLHAVQVDAVSRSKDEFLYQDDETSAVGTRPNQSRPAARGVHAKSPRRPNRR